jgi:hypothetical protein
LQGKGKGKGKGKSTQVVEDTITDDQTKEKDEKVEIRRLRTLDVFAGCGGMYTEGTL